MVLIAVRQGVGLTGLFALKTTLRVLLMIRGQCEATALLATPMRKSIVCDEGRFTSPEECALAPSFSSPKESRSPPKGVRSRRKHKQA